MVDRGDSPDKELTQVKQESAIQVPKKTFSLKSFIVTIKNDVIVACILTCHW